MPPVPNNVAPAAPSALPAIPQQAPVADPQLAAVAPATQLKNAKPDYGWLSALMARWIEDLDKRYPAMLRTEGIQGRVTLTALLHEDGVLRDVRVAKSSGNAMLDQVALEDVKNGAPLTLSRPLERPQIPVKFSIIYDLKTDR
jgi:TonB family protein